MVTDERRLVCCGVESDWSDFRFLSCRAGCCGTFLSLSNRRRGMDGQQPATPEPNTQVMWMCSKQRLQKIDIGVQLRTVTRCLTPEATKTTVQAFISCRLDYCNALLYGIADDLRRRLQSVQNAAARLDA